MTDYLPIKTEFSYGGDEIVQIIREGDYAVYRRTMSSGQFQFEVIVVQRQAEKEFQGKVYPPMEIYPSSSQWGVFGWTFVGSEEDAIAYMRKKAAEKEIRNVAVRKRERRVP